MWKSGVLVVIAGIACLWGQPVRLPANLEKLADQADHSVTVTLDSHLLRLIARFDKDVEARKALDGVESVHVRSFQFRFEDEYKGSDVDALRSQFQAPGWSRIVGVRSRRWSGDGDVDVFFKDGGNGKLAGIVVIAAEPREFTFVSIDGSLLPEQLARLGGQFHIPRLDLGAIDSSRRNR
jgi:hypothetical protein